jgi:crotonobetainyl-CoA:carnitine CoA-transferase CaiB-like acyl-CoA transferase
VNQASAVVAGGVVPRRLGNAHPSLHPYEPFPTATTDLVVAVGNDGQFARLCAVLGLPQLAEDDRFRTMGARTVNREALRPLLTERLRARAAEDWFAELRAAGVPCGPILGVDGGLELAESLGLEPVVTTGHGDRRIPAVRHPIRYAGTTVDYSQAPPLLDADRERVLRWLAGGRATRPS